MPLTAAKQIFSQVFMIIGHEEKEAGEISEKILEKIQETALVDMVVGVQDQSKREEILIKFQDIVNFDTDEKKTALSKFFSEHFQTETFENALKNATTKIMKKYFQEIFPSLSQEQKNSITQLFSSYQDKL